MDKEIRDTFEEKNQNRATGCDQIPIELIQCLEKDGKQIITRFVYFFWAAVKQ